MSGDPASLDNLRDLALPPAVPFWPPAPACGSSPSAALRGAGDRRLAGERSAIARNAYRRAALAELDARPAIAGGSIEAVSAVLKRAALVAYAARAGGAAHRRAPGRASSPQTGAAPSTTAVLGADLGAAYDAVRGAGATRDRSSRGAVRVRGHARAGASGGG